MIHVIRAGIGEAAPGALFELPPTDRQLIARGNYPGEMPLRGGFWELVPLGVENSG